MTPGGRPFPAGSATLGADGETRIEELARLLERQTALRAKLIPAPSRADFDRVVEAGDTHPLETLAGLAENRAQTVRDRLTRERHVDPQCALALQSPVQNVTVLEPGLAVLVPLGDSAGAPVLDTRALHANLASRERLEPAAATDRGRHHADQFGTAVSSPVLDTHSPRLEIRPQVVRAVRGLQAAIVATGRILLPGDGVLRLLGQRGRNAGSAEGRPEL